MIGIREQVIAEIRAGTSTFHFKERVGKHIYSDSEGEMHWSTDVYLAPEYTHVKDADFSDVDDVFCCLPHGTTQIIKALPREIKIVDLLADFLLHNIDEYKEWYGQPHRAPKLQAKLIEVRNIIIDAKSGVSGAGRGAKEANLYTEIAEGIHSYGITKNRHVPEIEQGLSDASSTKVIVSFTPHLMPMSRGMQSTIYVEMASGVTTDDLYQCLSCYYENLLEKGAVPHTRNVRGSNYCFMNAFGDRITGRAIIVCYRQFGERSFRASTPKP